jgi:hypothetical protein
LHGLIGQKERHRDLAEEIAGLKPFMAAGYTFYTIDPSDYVDESQGTI